MVPKALLLRLILTALAAAAACGVAAMLLDHSRAPLRLMGSAFTVVAACGLLLPVSASDAGRSATPLQTVWTVFVTGCAAAVLTTTWTESRPRLLEHLILGWFVCGTASMMVAWAPLRAMDGRPLPGRAGTTALTGTAIAWVTGMALLALSSPVAWSDNELPLQTFFLLLAGTVVTACALAGWRPSPATIRDRAIALVGAASGVLGTLGLTATLWLSTWRWIQNPPDAWLAAGTLVTSWGVTAAVWTLLGLETDQGALRWLRLGATATTAAIGGMLAFIIQRQDSQAWAGAMAGRILGALVIVDASSLLAGAVLLRAARLRRTNGSEATPLQEMSMRCPRCRRALTARCGETTCAGCGLVVMLDFRDDACACCRYDLRGSPATACPECGRARQLPSRPGGG